MIAIHREGYLDASPGIAILFLYLLFSLITQKRTDQFSTCLRVFANLSILAIATTAPISLFAEGIPGPNTIAAHAGPGPVSLRNWNPEQPLGLQMEILQDPQGRLSFDDVQKPAYTSHFHPSERNIPNFGFTSDVYWVHFRANNDTKISRWILEIPYPPIDSISFHWSPDGKIWNRIKTGDNYPFAHRPVDHRNFLFPLEIPPGSQAQFYIRFQTQGSHQYPVYILSETRFHEMDRKESYAFGFYYGILFILILYNLVLFLLAKDRSYLLYLLYITGFGTVMLNLNGLAYSLLWPNWPWWENRSLPFFIGWAFLWSLQFARSFLNTESTAPAVDRMMRALMVAMSFLILLSLTIPYSWAIMLSALLVIFFSVLVLLAGLASLRRGYRPARYFLVAWAILLLGTALYALKGLGILPSNFATDYGLQIGSALEMSLLSLGLGDRIHVINEERHASRLLAAKNERLYHEARLKSTRLEMELLKKNIEPHFMLNSINATIVWMREDPETAVRLLGRLAEELRLLLQVSGLPLIPLEQELTLCRSHLEVMGLRHDKSFTLETKGLDGTETIPPLLFHTILENGLTHGFAERERGSFLLEKRLDNKDITLYCISNDGVPTSSAHGSGGMGFRFIRTKLEEVYPSGWTLEYGPEVGRWTVRITINPSRFAGTRDVTQIRDEGNQEDEVAPFQEKIPS